MRRLWIVYYWIFQSKNNVTFSELLHFIFKPTVRSIAERYIETISSEEQYDKIKFKKVSRPLYWPRQFPVDGIYQVAAETFDHDDWHYYQKPCTPMVQAETLLDVGTAEGLFVLSVIDRCRNVILVEPNDYFIEALGRSFKNDMHKVIIHNVAVGSQAGEISFRSASLSGSVVADGKESVRKKIETIDHLINAATMITYFKADIEGFEMEMLKGAVQTIRRCKPKIAITSYHTENNAEEIIAFVKSIVPEYNSYTKGIIHEGGKPVMIHFWI